MRANLAFELAAMKLTVHPLTPERWPDLEALFNSKGGSVARGCWGRFYRPRGWRGQMPKATSTGQAPAPPRTEASSGPAGMLDHLLRRSLTVSPPRRGNVASRWRDCLCQEARRNSIGSVPGRQARPIQRRCHVVRCQVDV